MNDSTMENIIEWMWLEKLKTNPPRDPLIPE